MILITGGLGYIGSHTVVELIKNKSHVIIVDNLSNSKIEVLYKLNKLTGVNIKFYQYDLLNLSDMENIFIENDISGIIHFAGYKSVSDSITNPLEYYENNIQGTLNLLKLCKKYNVYKFIFSSSATVYGNAQPPFSEKTQTGIGITNPYGTTKFFIEQILKDYCIANNKMDVVILRYFNPVGAHESGIIGEDPNSIPSNLLPFILKVIVKNNFDPSINDVYDKLKIYGNDYNTKDGTCIRDFIHVVDLAVAHVVAYNKDKTGVRVHNVGTGIGYTVKEIVDKMIEVNGMKLPYVYADRRPGDCEATYCTVDKEFDWKCEKTLEDICRDSYNYIKNN